VVSFSMPTTESIVGGTSSEYLALVARGKLRQEANRRECRLDRLVSHANMLDRIVLNSSNVESELEQYYDKLFGSSEKPKTLASQSNTYAKDAQRAQKEAAKYVIGSREVRDILSSS